MKMSLGVDQSATFFGYYVTMNFVCFIFSVPRLMYDLNAIGSSKGISTERTYST